MILIPKQLFVDWLRSTPDPVDFITTRLPARARRPRRVLGRRGRGSLNHPRGHREADSCHSRAGAGGLRLWATPSCAIRRSSGAHVRRRVHDGHVPLLHGEHGCQQIERPFSGRQYADLRGGHSHEPPSSLPAIVDVPVQPRETKLARRFSASHVGRLVLFCTL